MIYWLHSRIAIGNCHHVINCNISWFASFEFWSSDTGQTDGQKAMHMSPPCISTGVLKNDIDKNILSNVAKPVDLDLDCIWTLSQVSREFGDINDDIAMEEESTHAWKKRLCSHDCSDVSNDWPQHCLLHISRLYPYWYSSLCYKVTPLNFFTLYVCYLLPYFWNSRK